MEDAAGAREDVVDELVDLVVDQLVPVLGWYRDQLARRLSVTLVPHAERDLVLELVPTRVRGAVRHVVSTLGLRQEPRRRVAAETLIHVVQVLGREAWVMGHRAAGEAHARELRRERERAGRRPRWQW